MIMTQAEFLGFVEVDFDLRSPGISRDGRDDFQLQVSRHEIPGLELRQLRDDHDQDAHPAGAPGLRAAQEDFGVVDFDHPFFALNTELDALCAEALRKPPEQLIDPAFPAIDFLASSVRLTARGEVDDLI